MVCISLRKVSLTRAVGYTDQDPHQILIIMKIFVELLPNHYIVEHEISETGRESQLLSYTLLI